MKVSRPWDARDQAKGKGARQQAIDDVFPLFHTKEEQEPRSLLHPSQNSGRMSVGNKEAEVGVSLRHRDGSVLSMTDTRPIACEPASWLKLVSHGK